MATRPDYIVKSHHITAIEWLAIDIYYLASRILYFTYRNMPRDKRKTNIPGQSPVKYMHISTAHFRSDGSQ